MADANVDAETKVTTIALPVLLYMQENELKKM